MIRLIIEETVFPPVPEGKAIISHKTYDIENKELEELLSPEKYYVTIRIIGSEIKKNVKDE